MMALPENAIEPSKASSKPGQTTRTAGTAGASALASAASVDERIEAILAASIRPRRASAVSRTQSAEVPASERYRLAIASRVAGRDIPFDRLVAEAPDELPGTEVLVAVADHV